jgi:hypothetical protein
MELPTSQSELADLFRKFGARDPESWASSQLQEGIPQLQRFLFLRQAWANVVAEDDISWIGKAMQQTEREANAPYGDIGRVLRSCLAKGISAQDLTSLARALQAEFLFSMCYLLDDPTFRERELQDFSWGLFEVDADGKPIPPRIGGLHESVLETDPTGREVRPAAK